MDLQEARAILEKAEYWHYRFQFPWAVTVPTKPGWAERVEKRRQHFFAPLLEMYGGSLHGKTVQDLGCCQGFWSFESRKAGAILVRGIDSSASFIREAQAAALVFGIEGCHFSQAHLEDDPWWHAKGVPADVTLMLGVLYHLTDLSFVLRKAMGLTKETIVLDGEVARGDDTCLFLRPRTPTEPTTVRSNITSSLRTIPAVSALVALLKDGGFRSVRILTPQSHMPPDYHAGTTASIIATRT